MLTITKNEQAVLKESYTVRSTSSYSYSETSANTVQQLNESVVSNDTSNANTKERKVSSLTLTPVTIPDPPAHLNSCVDPQHKTQTTGSPPPTSSPPQRSPILSQPVTQTALISVRLDKENKKNPASSKTNSKVELEVSDQMAAPAPSQVEMTKPPPAIPPRPSPAKLLVHNWLQTGTAEQNTQLCSFKGHFNPDTGFMSWWHQDWLKGNTPTASCHLVAVGPQK